LAAAVTALAWHPTNSRRLAVGTSDGEVTVIALDNYPFGKVALDFDVNKFWEQAKKEADDENWRAVTRAISLVAAHPGYGIDAKEIDNLRFRARKAVTETISNLDRSTSDPDELAEAAEAYQLAIDIDPLAPLAATAREALGRLTARTPASLEKHRKKPPLEPARGSIDRCRRQHLDHRQKSQRTSVRKQDCQTPYEQAFHFYCY
jgi:hypothetical protein